MGSKKNDVILVSEKLESKLTSNLKNNAKKEVEVGVEIDTPEVVVDIEALAPKVQPIKMVKILAKVNHQCCIGGEWYYLLKDKQYNVPQHVKEILMNADKLSPL